MGDTRAGIAPQVDTYANWVSANPTLGKDDSGDSFNQMIFATGSPVGDILIWGNAQTFTASFAAGQYIIMGAQVGNATLETYETAWINRSDWTNVHLGTDDTKDVDSNLNHALDAPLSDLIVKVFISTNGTDANSFEPVYSVREDSTANHGVSIFNIDNNNIKIQTGASGLGYTLDAGGNRTIIDIQDWYYKVKVYKLT